MSATVTVAPAAGVMVRVTCGRLCGHGTNAGRALHRTTLVVTCEAKRASEICSESRETSRLLRRVMVAETRPGESASKSVALPGTTGVAPMCST